MKVILLKEVQGRGGEGDVIVVKDGFANNYLLPQGYALKATKGNLAQLEQRKAHIAEREVKRVAEAEETKKKIDGIKFKIDVQIGEEGQLFGAVTSQMVADGIKANCGVEIDKRRVEMRKAIKAVGLYRVDVSIYRNIKASIEVVVGAESMDEFLGNDKKKDKKADEKKPEKQEVAAEESVEEDTAEPEAESKEQAEEASE